jgi:hypothetical protein
LSSGAIALVAIAALVEWNVLRDGLPLSLDSSSQYWPWYAYLGDQLRTGHVPAWNPSAFGGAPFAADPLSGWTYLPAMLFFALLPVDAAINAFILCHFLLASVGMYALARALGLQTSAALVAGCAYAYSGFFQFNSVAAQPYVGVAAWLPIALLGTELAIRADQLGPRLRAWALSGLALSQSLAIWPGQGSYYAALVFGVWTCARAMALKPRATAVHLIVPLVIGVALDAAAVLPRLELQKLSNLADGYPTTELVGGWQPADFVRLITPGQWTLGITTAGLCAVGLLRVARRPAAPFVLATTLWATGLVLAISTQTPLHSVLFYLLPGFARLHPHVAERVLIVTFFAPALLAGLGFQFVAHRSRHRLLSSSVVAALGIELLVMGRLAIDRQVGAPWDALTRVRSYSSASAATSAAQFLQAQPRSPVSRFRFIGLAPYVAGRPVPYTLRFDDPATQALLVNNRAIALEPEDLQGYNAVHVARFDAYLRMVNGGRTQNYHDGQVLGSTASAPLLDLLGVRYLVVGPDGPVDAGRVVYDDAMVRIVERSSALPRSWNVHDARQTNADDALRLIDARLVDPRQTVLLEQAPVEATATYAVFNEVAYPGWTAYVDGRAVQPIPADGLLQAVPVPPGTHSVELRFESLTLQIGLAMSIATLGCLTALLVLTREQTRSAALPGFTRPFERLSDRRRTFDGSTKSSHEGEVELHLTCCHCKKGTQDSSWFTTRQ